MKKYLFLSLMVAFLPLSLMAQDDMYFVPKKSEKTTLSTEAAQKALKPIRQLEMTVDEACDFFANHRKISDKLNTLKNVGLGYVKLGQSATTLSGGEAQRVKLATELSKRSTGRTMYILDEPTTGLHIADVHRLINVLQKFADDGNTVVVIEHNLDLIKTADYIIDLGLEGGDGGGTVIATGTPEEIAQSDISYTGKYLKKQLAISN